MNVALLGASRESAARSPPWPRAVTVSYYSAAMSRISKERARPGSPRRVLGGCRRLRLAAARGFAMALASVAQQLGKIETVVVSAGAFATRTPSRPTGSGRARCWTWTSPGRCSSAKRRASACSFRRRNVASSARWRESAAESRSSSTERRRLASRYLEGARPQVHAQGLRVVCVKPGFVKTSMTQGLKPPPFAGEARALPAGAASDRPGYAGGLHRECGAG